MVITITSTNMIRVAYVPMEFHRKLKRSSNRKEKFSKQYESTAPPQKAKRFISVMQVL